MEGNEEANIEKVVRRKKGQINTSAIKMILESEGVRISRGTAAVVVKLLEDLTREIGAKARRYMAEDGRKVMKAKDVNRAIGRNA